MKKYNNFLLYLFIGFLIVISISIFFKINDADQFGDYYFNVVFLFSILYGLIDSEINWKYFLKNLFILIFNLTLIILCIYYIYDAKNKYFSFEANAWLSDNIFIHLVIIFIIISPLSLLFWWLKKQIYFKIRNYYKKNKFN